MCHREHQQVFAHRRHDENMLTRLCKKFNMLDMPRSHLDPAVSRELHSRIAVKDTDGDRCVECSEWLENVGGVLS